MAKEIRKPRVGSLIEFYIPNGLKLVGGQAAPERKLVKGKIRIVNADSYVCVVGKRYGHPYVVDTYRLVRY
jgi:hypothetical protein